MDISGVKINDCLKVTIMGCSNVGKTSIINRLINKNFTPNYNPTTGIETYIYKLNLNDEEVAKKKFINVIIQDTFGIDNPILSKPKEILISDKIKEQRDKMSQEFKNLMLTSQELRNKISSEKKIDFKKKKDPDVREEILIESCNQRSKHIERGGFIFVCDCGEEKTLKSVCKIINKLQEIEKANNLIYPKMLLFNKFDKVNDKYFSELIKKNQSILENYKGRYKIECLRVSALTGLGILESFKRFISKLHEEVKNREQNDGIKEQDGEDDKKIVVDFKDKWYSCTKQMFCGNTFLSCNVRYKI